jgi:PAS domain S-box-containing protein
VPKPEPYPKSNSILRLLQRLLITPTPVPVHLDEQRRAQALLLTLLVAFLLGSITSLVRYVNSVPAIATNIGLVLLIVLYVMSRWRFHRLGIRATIIIASLICPVIFAIVPTAFDPMTALSAALIAILLADLLASPRTTVLIFVFNLTLLTMMVWFVPDASNFERLQWIMPLVFVSPFIIIKSYVTQHDVRQLRKQAEKLTANEAQFSNLFSAMPEAVIIKSDTNQVTFCNDRAAQLLGFSDKAQVIGLQFDAFIKPGQSTRLRRDDHNGIITIRYRDQLKTAQGDTFPVKIVATTLAFTGELATLMVLYREDTSEMYSDEYLMLKAAVEYTKDAICITDTDLETGPHILFVNPTYTRLTGYSETEIIGKHASILHGTSSLPERRDKLYEAVAKRKSVLGASTTYRKDGQPFEAEWEIVPVGNREQLTYLVETMRDVTLQSAIEIDLHEKQERFAMMSELMSDYAYALEVKADGSLQLQWITGAYQNVFGRSYDELIAHNGWNGFVHPDERILYQMRQKALLDGEAGTIEYRIVRPDGTTRWVSDRTRPMLDEAGQVSAIYGAAHDVTERILADEALRTEAIQKAVIAELGLMALRTTDQDELFNHALMLCQAVLESAFGIIVTCDPRQFSIIAAIPDYPDIGVGTTFPLDEKLSLFGYALQATEPLVITQLETETRFSVLPQIQTKPVTSGCAIVIQGAAEPYGVLALYAREPQHFSDDNTYFLQSVTNVLATFTERLRAQQAEQEEHYFAEILREATLAINAQRDLDEVLESILVALSNFITAHVRASILLLDEDSQMYRFAYLHGFPPEAVDRIKQRQIAPDEWGTIRHMLESGQTLMIPDVTQNPLWTPAPGVPVTRSSLGVPIVVRGQTIGFIFLGGEDVAAFSQKDAERLKTLADKIGNAILNARHAKLLQQMVDKATAELRQEQEQLQAILDATGDGIFYTENGVMRYANRALADMTGFALDEFIGRETTILHPTDVTDAELVVLKSAIVAVEQDEIWRSEVRLARKDGTGFPAALTISRVGQIKDGVRQAVVVVRDISHEKAVDEIKDRFIANAAHELRTPITNLNTTMYLIRRQPENVERQIEKLERIVERMNRLVADLLDIAAIQDGRIKLQPSATILQDVVQNVVNLQTAEANKKSIVLVNDMLEEPIQIWADSYRMEQVFTNLISNAIRHTPENGQIRIFCNYHQAEHEVIIVVEDNGEGIPQADLAHIFEPFYRVGGKKDENGTGLGLSITHEIVIGHNGTIGVESTTGNGTSFYITLPTLGD